MATFMFEVYYAPPESSELESELLRIVEKHGGWLDCHEEASEHTGVCLTYEFNRIEDANLAAAELRGQGHWVEGPVQYT